MKTVLITGCSSGFGLLAAKKLAARGDRVFATMRDPFGKNRNAAEELVKLNIEVLDLDVTSESSVETAAETMEREGGAPDVIINNAGQMFVGLIEAFTGEELSNQLDVNIVGVHRVTRAFLPAMRKQSKGLFINISSIAGRLAIPFFAIYNASKWAVEGYSLAARRELASVGVDVVVVEPGPFTTELFPQSPHPQDTEHRAKSYPDVFNETFEDMNSAFEGMFSNPEVPTDPAMVVDKFIELIDMAPGTRPFRNVVGVDLGVTERNASDEVHDAPFLEAMHLAKFVKLQTN